MSSPALPQDIFNQVTKAWFEQDYALGERILSEARIQYPDHWHLRTCHAAALAYCSRFHSARQAFDQLIADSPKEKRLHMHGLLGVEWCRIGRHDLAIPLLEIAASAPQAPAPVFEALGSAWERLNRLDRSFDVLSQAQLAYPKHPGIDVALARTKRRLKQHDSAIALAREVIRNPIASPDAKAAASMEIGHCLDAESLYAEAFAAYQSAKQLRQSTLGPLMNLWHERQQHLTHCQLPTRHEFLSWRNSFVTEPPIRISFLVGCPRSGTTLLERVLEAHPDLVAASETSIFDNLWKDVRRHQQNTSSQQESLLNLTASQQTDFRSKYIQFLQDALEQPIDGRMILDKNPSLLPRIPAILRLFPEARILMAERDPRAIAWSCFIQYLPENGDAAAFQSPASAASHVATHLQFWFRLRDQLPEDSWHSTKYEQVVTHFDQEIHDTLNFMGLPWLSRLNQYHQNPAPVRSPSYADAARPIYSDALEKWRHYAPFLGDSFRCLDEWVHRMGYSA